MFVQPMAVENKSKIFHENYIKVGLYTRLVKMAFQDMKTTHGQETRSQTFQGSDEFRTRKYPVFEDGPFHMSHELCGTST